MSKWSKIKNNLVDLSSQEQLNIIAELYKLSEQNKDFLSVRFLKDGSNIIDKYKKTIKRYMCPDITKRDQYISIPTAKKAISDYKKTTRDVYGTIELMTYYVECGHKYLEKYGDAKRNFYDSIISVFDQVIDLLKEHLDLKEIFYNRLKYISDDSRNFGYGYDCLYEDYKDFLIKSCDYYN